MYTLHIANKNYSSWSLRPWVLMRTLAIAFDEQLTPFPTGSSWSLYRPFSPSGRVPCLVDDGWAVWDLLAIAEYLAERHAGVWPSDARARAWARSAAAEMHSSFTALRNDCPMSCGVRVKPHPLSDALKHDLFRLGDLWSDGLRRFRRTVPRGQGFHRGRRILCAGGVSHPVLWPADRRSRCGLCATPAGIAGDAGMVSVGARRDMARGGPRGRDRRCRHPHRGFARIDLISP